MPERATLESENAIVGSRVIKELYAPAAELAGMVGEYPVARAGVIEELGERRLRRD